MNNEHLRKKRILSKVIKHQEWQLDKLNTRLIQSEESLRQSVDGETKLALALDDNLTLLERMINGGQGIDIASVIDIQRFISLQEDTLVIRKQKRTQCELDLRSLQNEYAQSSLVSKGYERARDKSAKKVVRQTEAVEQVSSLDLWIQTNSLGIIRNDL